MGAVHREQTIAQGVNAGWDDLAAAVGALAGKTDHAEQGPLGDAEGNRGVVWFGAHRQGFGQPDFAPGTRGANHTDTLGLDRFRVAIRQTRRGGGERFQFVVLSQCGERKQRPNQREKNKVFHGNREGRTHTDFWSGRPDSNRRHRPWQGRTLPAELLPLSVKLYFYPET